MAKDITAKGYLSGNITAKANLSGDITASGALGQTVVVGGTIPANATVAVYGRSRSGYYIYAPQLTIEQTA